MGFPITKYVRYGERHGTLASVRPCGELRLLRAVRHGDGLPGLPRDPWMSADTLPAFGFCNGCPDVSMDAHSLYVEKAWAAAGVTIVACACSPDPPSSAG
ncbi:hypothetical protein GCM10009574_071590 [Streptomyces asiaticus]|uniref:Uncharacterized protein n=2 Tax=Streptomyces rhizosphaericus TaxID=114699 RepID=A0ABN1QFJ6_9ACTN